MSQWRLISLYTFYRKDIDDYTLDESYFILVNHNIPNPRIDAKRVIEVVNNFIPKGTYAQNVATELVREHWSASDMVARRMAETTTTDSSEFFHLLYCALLVQTNPHHLTLIKERFIETDDKFGETLGKHLTFVGIKPPLLLYRNVQMVWNKSRNIKIAIVELYASANVSAKKKKQNLNK